MANYPYSNVTLTNGATVLGATGTSYPTASITVPNTWANSAGINPSSGKIALNGEDADITVNGQSLVKTMQTIQDRLAILVPDPKKLEQFEALKQAYEHYKTLEALCCETTTPKSDK